MIEGEESVKSKCGIKAGGGGGGSGKRIRIGKLFRKDGNFIKPVH